MVPGAGSLRVAQPTRMALEVSRLVDLVSGLPTARTLDVASGTGSLTRHLRGVTVGLDRSPAMVALDQSRLPAGVAIVSDALNLQFADGAYDRVLAGHFYGHLPLDVELPDLPQTVGS